MGNVIKVDICRDRITKQVVTKFGNLKIDNGGDTVNNFDAMHYHTTYGKLTTLSSSCSVIRTHHLRLPNFVTTCPVILPFQILAFLAFIFQ